MYFLAEGPRRFVRHLGQVFRLRRPRPFSPSRNTPVAYRKRALPSRRRLRWGFTPRFPVRPPPGGTPSPIQLLRQDITKAPRRQGKRAISPAETKKRAGKAACSLSYSAGNSYFSTFSIKRLSIAAACARFASPLGISRPLASPRSSPAPTAQFIALTA